MRFKPNSQSSRMLAHIVTLSDAQFALPDLQVGQFAAMPLRQISSIIQSRPACAAQTRTLPAPPRERTNRRRYRRLPARGGRIQKLTSDARSRPIGDYE